MFVTLFNAINLFLSPMKISENHEVPDVFRGNRNKNRTVGGKNLIILSSPYYYFFILIAEIFW